MRPAVALCSQFTGVRLPFLMLLVLFVSGFSASASNPSLHSADSLFSAKKYTEAFATYQTLLEGGHYSPQMLLKMAYVKEALNDYTQALYYLNLSYHYEPNKEVLQKMEVLASEYDLRGYEFSDYEYVASIYHEYEEAIAIGGSLLVALGVGLLFWLKRRGSHVLAPALGLVTFAIALAATVNFGFPLSQAILTGQKAFLMKAPSAGSELVETVGAGHRVETIGKEDIWYKVRWNEQEVFVRESNVLPIE